MKRIIIFACICILGVPLLFSESLSVDLQGALTASTPDAYLEGGISDDVGATLRAKGDFYSLDVNLSLSNDGRLIPHSPYQLGHYFYTDQSMARVFFKDVSFKAGRGVHTDVVRSPYSVYINPNALPAVHAQIDYGGDMFSYSTRWVRLNVRSAQEYNGLYDADGIEGQDTLRDRGMTFKTYALDLGYLTLGFEDVSLYLDRAFDAESFLSPFPMYFLEMLTTSAGRPWSEINNTNSLMGFFCEYERPGLYLEGQVLVDDINASILAPVLGWAIPALNNITNLSKVAWSLGGHYTSPAGRFGFYHGGALKYTFEATYVSEDLYSTLPYEYTYYPLTEYDAGEEYRPLDYTENYIGYKYGENNLAFLADYAGELFPNKPWSFGLYASLEWVLNGSKSPANPWHRYDHWNEINVPWELLPDDTIEHTLQTRIILSKPFRNWLFTLDGTLGYVWNRLELREEVADEPKIYMPVAGNNHPVASLTLGVNYLWNIKD